MYERAKMLPPSLIALRPKKRRVKKRNRAQAHQLQVRICPNAHLSNQRLRIVISRINVQVIQKVLQPLRHILMHEMQQPHPRPKEQGRLDQFKHRNHPQQGIRLARFTHGAASCREPAEMSISSGPRLASNQNITFY